MVVAGLRGFDATAVAELATLGVRVVVVSAQVEAEERARLLAIGACDVVALGGGAADAAAAVTAAAVTAAAGPPPRATPGSLADPRTDLRTDSSDAALRVAAVPDAGLPDLPARSDRAPGRLAAVWGPVGAPGRTTVAVGVAAEAARAGHAVLLVNADTYGASVAQVLGLLDEASGLAAACRHASAGRLDDVALAAVARRVPHAHGLRVLTGLPRPDRWPELHGAALEHVLATARRLVDLVVVDCGFSLEEDEELVFDSLAPRRNAATFVALEAADEVVVVGGGAPVAVQRLVRGLADLREAVPSAPVRVLVNRVPRTGRREVAEVLARHAGAAVAAFVPEDAGVGLAAARGATLAEASPRSPARAPLAQTAAALLGIASDSASDSDSSSGRPASLLRGFIRKVPRSPTRRKPDPTQVAHRVDWA